MSRDTSKKTEKEMLKLSQRVDVQYTKKISKTDKGHLNRKMDKRQTTHGRANPKGKY